MEALVLTGLALWSFIVGSVIAAVIVMCLLETEHQFWSFALFAAGFYGATVVLGIPLVDEVRQQPIMLAYYLAVHVLIGVAWSIYRWKYRTEKTIKSWLKDEYHHKRELEMLKKAKDAMTDAEIELPASVNPGRNKDVFFGYIFLWPLSMIAFICKDWLVALWDLLYAHVGKLYIKISKRVMRKMAALLPV